MFFQDIALTNFKNYPSLQLEFSAGMNVFTGLNGVGKTNLLDALYYCCMTRSYFTPQDKYTIREGAEFFRIEAHYQKKGVSHLLEVRVKPGSLKTFSVDNVIYDQLSGHIGEIPAVIIAPKDVELILGGSVDRRRYLDATLSQLGRPYLDAVIKYNQFLNQRNAHLKSVRDGQRPDYALLEAYAEKMAPHAEYITGKRREGVADLEKRVKEVYRDVATDAEPVDLVYKPSLEGVGLLEACRNNLRRDCALGRTLAGVHRDDVGFFLKGQEFKRFASQGQLKSFLIALNLGKYFTFRDQLGVSPVVFLDDSFGKLDHLRTAHLLDILSGEAFGQVFVTDTSASRIKSLLETRGLGARMTEVSDGTITSSEDFTPD